MTVLTYRNEATAWKLKNEAIREFKNEASRPRKPGERSELAEFKNEANRPKFEANGPLSREILLYIGQQEAEHASEVSGQVIERKDARRALSNW